MTSTLLAHPSGLGVDKESFALMDANPIFLLVVLCAAVKLTLERAAWDFDIVILLKVCFGFVLAALRCDGFMGSYVGAVFRILLAVATTPYSV